MKRRRFLKVVAGLFPLAVAPVPHLKSRPIPGFPLGEIPCLEAKVLQAGLSNTKLLKILIKYHYRQKDLDLAKMFCQLRWSARRNPGLWRRQVQKGWVPSPDLETTLRVRWQEAQNYLADLEVGRMIPQRLAVVVFERAGKQIEWVSGSRGSDSEEAVKKHFADLAIANGCKLVSIRFKTEQVEA